MVVTAVLTGTHLTRKQQIRDLALTVTGSFLIALMAHVAILPPFSPILFTGQLFAVILMGALLGRRF